MDPNQKIILLKGDVLQSDFAIKVRVVRRWTTPDWQDPNGFYSIELIIQDEENAVYHLEEIWNSIDKLLDENLPLLIYKPSQAENRAKYKHVNCAQKIVFTPKTKVTLCTSFNGNPFGFYFYNFQDILDKRIAEDDLIDVIGVVAKRFDTIRDVSTNGKPTNRMNILIEKLEKQGVKITLFDKFCDQMEAFVEKNPDAINVVVVLQFAKARWFQGDPYVSNSFDAARLFIDENIEDIISFKKRLVSRSPDPTSTSQYSISSSLVASAVSIRETKLIIWDEAPMTHKHAFEALDRTMRDILFSPGSNDEIPFGGKTIVFGGDFRQILPVIQNGSRQQIVNASLSSSYIWSKCKLLTLTKNMRLSIGSDTHDLESTKEFANWLLELGEGKIGEFNDGESTIQIPDDLLFEEIADPISTLVDFLYPSILQNYNNPGFFSERSPTNEYVQEINDYLLSQFPGEEKEYLSSDTVCQTEFLNGPLEESLYAPDVLNVLNGLKISGLPNHKLILKVGVPVMLLRNIDLQNGLCNGTRLQIVSLGNRVIEAEIISGANIGIRTFIPRINMIPSDKRIPFKF